MVAASRPHPPIHPTHGPKALEDQVNVVPESGMALFSCRYPTATRSIGMNPTRKMAGRCVPTAAAVGPRAPESV